MYAKKQMYGMELGYRERSIGREGERPATLNHQKGFNMLYNHMLIAHSA
jgi:hypothetical protein